MTAQQEECASPVRDRAFCASSSFENCTWAKPLGFPSRSLAMVTFMTRPHLAAHKDVVCSLPVHLS